MNPDQASQLGKRIINTMRPTPALPEWIEVLEPLEFDNALITFRSCRDRSDEGLRIATFLSAYNRRSGDDARTPTRRDPNPHCVWCRGCGYEPGPPEYETIGGQPHEYTTVVPCRCTQPASRRRHAPSAPSLLEEF